jgi:hypothetical protein
MTSIVIQEHSPGGDQTAVIGRHHQPDLLEAGAASRLAPSCVCRYMNIKPSLAVSVNMTQLTRCNVLAAVASW